jgi:hypothetical protein
LILIAKDFGGMAIWGLQRRLGFLGDSFQMCSPKYQTKRSSSITLVAIVIAHGLFIFVALNAKTKQRENFPSQSLLQLIQLQPEESVISEIQKPDVSFQSTAVHIQLPAIEINDAPHILTDLSDYQSVEPYELPNPNDALYGDVFDPQLRKKLQETHANRRAQKPDALNTWITSGGTTLVNMGDGECIRSIPKTDSRERGTSWSMLRVRCGKTDSEKMMDSVNADLEARKHPLKSQ